MSYESTKSSAQQWQLSRCEINKILEKLELSPLHSDNEGEDSILEAHGLSTEKDKSESRELSEPATIIYDKLDHDELCKTLLEAEKDAIINKLKNDWFHENLVKHFTKKQMGHVCCTDEIDNDDTINKYMSKLYDFYEMKKKLKVNDERWSDELSKIHFQIRAREEEEKKAIEDMFFTGTVAGPLVWNHGKLFPAKRAQEMISKQLEKIREISQERFHLAKLCSQLNSIQDSLNDLISINADLTKNGYDKLEAENFYYNMELQNKLSKCEQLVGKKQAMKEEMNLIRKKILETKTRILKYEKISNELQIEIQNLLRIKRSVQNELAIAKESVYTSEFFCCDRKMKIVSRLAEIRNEHKEWIEKINNIQRVIKERSEIINASKINAFMFKEKKLAIGNIHLGF